MGYIIGYDINCQTCHRNIATDVVFIDHVLHVRCPKCGQAYAYPEGFQPKGTAPMQGRYVCGKCGRLADFGRLAGTEKYEFRCNECLAQETAEALRKIPKAQSPQEVRSTGLGALIIGVPVAGLTAFLAIKESGWFVLTGCVALAFLVFAGNNLLRTTKVAEGSVADAQGAEELLGKFEDDTMSAVDKLGYVGLTPGSLWSTGYVADALRRRAAR